MAGIFAGGKMTGMADLLSSLIGLCDFLGGLFVSAYRALFRKGSPRADESMGAATDVVSGVVVLLLAIILVVVSALALLRRLGA